MRFNSRTWGLLSILLFVAAVWFWLRGNDEVARRHPNTNSIAPVTASSSSRPVAVTNATISSSPVTSVSTSTAGAATPPARDGFPYRLRNTGKPIDELGRLDTAILLDNAFIDTAVKTPLTIPEHLRAGRDPGSYVVQAHGLIDNAFYARLQAAGAEFVSYIPNNAVLVRANEDAAARLAASPQIQAVLRFEPYYKLSQSLLPLAVEKQPLPNDQALNIVAFPGQRDRVMAAIRDAGGSVIAEDRTPFGPLLTVQPDPDSLAVLAGVAEIQRIEPASSRSLLNDLTRVRLGVSTNTVTASNPWVACINQYLTGTNVLVNINDTGVDATQPDLVGRVFSTDTNSITLRDTEGHGTHVAGTIASSGASSSTVVGAEGSVPNANFRGKAPGANLFVLPIDLRVGPLASDTYLQETAAQENYVVARKTAPMISNNSWGYVNAFDYNSISASYDAAVRDALPGLPGSQPLLYVFAAGNSGFGTTNGVGGEAGSILSPANAKNVIAVGALESPRGLTNEAFAGYTDSDDEVASFSSRGNVGIGTEGQYGRFKPDVIAPGTFIVSTRSQNAPPDSFDLGPLYRYNTGTSMAAPAVSGLLALMQQYFELGGSSPGYSPALYKALLINGARSVNQKYDLRVRKSLNIEGWGVVNLTNSVPDLDFTDCPAGGFTLWPQRFIDQSAAGAITTGQKQTWKFTLGPRAQTLPLRATLVWTDPPGNPGAAIKLVNDLDLVITNLATGEVFIGNNFPQGGDFTTSETNEFTSSDYVNNVENIFLNEPLGTNYSITVLGRRVNVNAVTANTTGIVQDYALVLSSGNGEIISESEAPDGPKVDDGIITFTPEVALGFLPPVIAITNGAPLLKQMAGANFQLSLSTNGTPAQWNFYAFTNAFSTNNVPGMTNGSNVAFVTFLPPNLSLPRNLDADIDLYVSRDSQLTNLDVTAVNNSVKSRHRGGTEVVVFTNSPVGPDVIYYVGVKSEDQQSAEYGIIALSTDLPFDSAGPNGSRILQGYPPNVPIPDGSPDAPGGALVFAIGINPVIVGGVTVEDQITHESVGDLLGNLSHEDQFVVLNNHNRFDDLPGIVYNLSYDDGGSADSFASRKTDGPGSLLNFTGQTASGVWLLTMIDDSIGKTGVVNNLKITIDPEVFFANGANLADVVLGNQWKYYAVDVPPDATNLTVTLSQLSGPLNVYLRRGELPTTTEFDKSSLIDPPGGILSLGLGDVPPLNAGRYYIGVFNPTPVSVSYSIRAVIGIGVIPFNRGQVFSADTPLILLDDALTESSVFVATTRPVVDVMVGVRIDHPRASDLVLHLVNPEGTRTLLAENRGGDSTAGYGATFTTTNIFPRTATGGSQEDRNVIDTGQTSGTIKINYEFYFLRDTLRIYYEGGLIYDTGLTNGAGSISVNFGPGLSTDVTIVVNEGGSSDPSTAWNYTAQVVQERTIYTTFTDSTNLANIPIKFATPPFTNSAFGTVRTNQTILDDGFEYATNGVYPAGSYVSGWRVSFGQAAVYGATNVLGVLPNTGTNFVELREGTSLGSPAGVRTNLTVVPTRPYRMTFAYNRNPRTPAAIANVVAVYTNNVLAQFVYARTAGWKTATFDFATSVTSIDLEIRSAGATGVLIDSVMVTEHIESENRFFLPEEPMKSLVGEQALGKWTLEVEDNRAGPSTTVPPKLLSWDLEFIFANTNRPVITLTNCTPLTNVVSVYETNSCDLHTNTVAGSEMKYFIVQVPRRATLATNTVSGTGDLELWFNQNGLPSGGGTDSPGTSLGPNLGAVLILNTNTAPFLRPGERYYLGVKNVVPTATNTFTISVAFDVVETNLINVTALSNAVPYVTSIGATNALDYYQYTVSSNATSVTFDLLPANGNLDLIVRKALPIADPLPRPDPDEYDYISENTSTNADQIIVTPASLPVPLEPGIWYLGVYSHESFTVNYTITATESTNTGIGPNIITLTNGVPLDFTIGAGSALTNYFKLVVTNSSPAALFEVYNLNAEASLLVDFKNMPWRDSFWAADFGSPTRPAQVVIRTNTFPVNLNGDWYLAVDNILDVNLSFRIRAVVSTNGILVSGIPIIVTTTPSSPPGTSIDMAWPSVIGESYSIQTSMDLVTWATVYTVTALDEVMTYSAPIDPGQSMLYYRIQQISPP